MPIVEPEVLMDGAHTLERCEEVTNAVLDRVFSRLFAARVCFEGMVLKPNMVIAGKKCAQKSSPEQVARGHVAHLEAAGPGRSAGHRLPVGRPEPDRGDAAPVADECGGASAVAR